MARPGTRPAQKGQGTIEPVMTAAPDPQGDDLVAVLAALSHPQRVRILGTLTGGRDYVSRLAGSSG